MKYAVYAVAVAGVTWVPLHGPAGVALIALVGCAVVGAVIVEGHRSIRMLRGGQSLDAVPDRVQIRRALIIGAGPVGSALARSLEAEARYKVVGFLDSERQLPAEGRWEVLGDTDIAPEVVREHNVDEIFLADAPTWRQRLAEDLATHYPSVLVRVVPTAYEALTHAGKIESVGDLALLRVNEHSGWGREAAKRSFDVAASLVGLVLSLPALLLVALFIKLTSRGPVIFAQERVGRFGEPFVLYKFRTMIHDAEAATGPVLSSGRADDRLTLLGRGLKLCRIDEVPQLWNVLRGEMSLVGPRPERPCFVRNFESTIPGYARRHQVRPGITGMAQVFGNYHTRAQDKLRFDVLYIANQSVWLDLWLLARTVLVVFQPGRH